MNIKLSNSTFISFIQWLGAIQGRQITCSCSKINNVLVIIMPPPLSRRLLCSHYRILDELDVFCVSSAAATDDFSAQFDPFGDVIGQWKAMLLPSPALLS